MARSAAPRTTPSRAIAVHGLDDVAALAQLLGESLDRIGLDDRDAGITIESLLSITLQVANNSITIDPTGVTIIGNIVTVQGNVQTMVSSLTTEIEGPLFSKPRAGFC
jgi:hypothetical protein